MNVNWLELKKKIKGFAMDHGIDRIGFTTAEPFFTFKERLLEQRKNKYQSDFEEKDIKKRVNPSLLLPNAKSIISIALAYPSIITNFNNAKKDQDSKDYKGHFCRASWGQDYHLVLRKRLTILSAYIKELVSEAETAIMVDTGPLSDRAVAERAGIGWVGKNTNLIVPGLGSWVFLGEMITNLPLPADEPLENQCQDCQLCLEACPNEALLTAGQINARLCLAYLTQTKDFLDESAMTKLGNIIYGCDRCQTVCPYNQVISCEHHQEFKPTEASSPSLKSLLLMSNKQFKQYFGHLSGSWRGKTPIQRNAIIALANLKDQTSIPILVKMLHQDPREVIRKTAAWALVKLRSK